MEKIRYYCENTAAYYECDPGTELYELSRLIPHGCKYPVLAALVDNQLKELGFRMYTPHKVQFIDLSHTDGRRTYIRSLLFVLQKSVADLFPQYSLIVDYSLPNGVYAELRSKPTADGEIQTVVPVCQMDVLKIKERMEEIIKKNLPITRMKMDNAEAVKLFRQNGREEKASLAESQGRFFVTVYFLDGYPDTFYGPQLYSTGLLQVFDLIPYSYGFCLQSPSSSAPTKVADYRYQDKLNSVFKENSVWNTILGAHSINSVNQAIRDGHGKVMVQIAEALHERKYADIADLIFSRRDKVRLVLISGPSSSGKTTTSKRIALQCKVLGLNPVVVAMDNYFLNREFTPKDENGEFDFEALNALDLPLFNRQLNELFEGKEIDLPKYNFVKGERYYDGEKIRLHEKDILIMEGIHALNPELTTGVEKERIFKIYASALTSLSVDENNLISTTDSRLLRRMVRDYSNRGITPEDTILRWPSVRRGEERNIFPYQENSDVMFNSSLFFELPLFKYYAEPLLRRIPPSSAAHAESIRLLKFLSLVVVLTPDEIKCIPPTSILREFIGGSSFDY